LHRPAPVVSDRIGAEQLEADVSELLRVAQFAAQDQLPLDGGFVGLSRRTESLSRE
jgi:hypothetical protein